MALLLKNLLFTVIVPGAVGVYLPLSIAQQESTAGELAFWISCLLIGLGAALYVWSVWDFASIGHGTPAPIDAPKKLVVRGPYQYLRNPMYVAVLAVIAGWAVRFQSATIATYGMAVACVFHLFVVLYEERHLQRTFGDEYLRYRAEVGRWLPKPSRKPAT
jgi:protein-S-isoprenylcysteine O-methyltransferase Ste14